MSYIHLLPTVCNCMHTFEVFVMWDVERIKQLWGRIIRLMLIYKIYGFSPFYLIILWKACVNMPPKGFLVNLIADAIVVWQHFFFFFWHIWWVKFNQVRGIYRLRLILGLSECYLAHLKPSAFCSNKTFF